MTCCIALLCLIQNVNVDKLTESLAQMRDKIGTEVFGPMSEWNRDYKKVQVSSTSSERYYNATVFVQDLVFEVLFIHTC